MPLYTYRRTDGSTFEIRQKFTDDPLTADPVTGEPVVRVVHAAGVIFKGSGFYVTDSKGASKTSTTTPAKAADGEKTATADAPAKSAPAESKPAPVTSAAAD
jgi:putative FmdB family regulatory protein